LYEREKTFPDLKSSNGKHYLRFDFWIDNLKILIEFDGEQHYKVTPHWGGEPALKNLIENDKKKDFWAKENGYKLIRIKFSEIDNIENILESQIHHINHSKE
jgi:very-short-patch-repair endonuclease